MKKKMTVEYPAVKGECPLCGEGLDIPEGCVASRCPGCREVIDRKKIAGVRG